MTTATAVRIRSAGESDVSAVTEIYAHHVRYGCATFEIDPPTVSEMLLRYTNIAKAGLPYLVAEIDGQIVGYAYAGPYRTRPAYRFTVEDSIYLSPEWTGKGIGRALLPELITRCERQGCREIVAVIGDSANEASIRLHTAFGFRSVGVLKNVGFKFDRWLDTVLMQRELRHPRTASQSRSSAQ